MAPISRTHPPSSAAESSKLLSPHYVPSTMSLDTPATPLTRTASSSLTFRDSPIVDSQGRTPSSSQTSPATLLGHHLSPRGDLEKGGRRVSYRSSFWSSGVSDGSWPNFTISTPSRGLRHDSIWQTKDSEDIPTGVEGGLPRSPALPMPPNAEEASFSSALHEYLFIFTVCLAQLFSLGGLAQSFAPLLVISSSFGVKDPGQMSWYTSAYSMTLGTFILPAGRLGDMLGHKRMFIIGWIWFSVGSLICGFSYLGGPIMLSACRGFQGIGPALLVPNGIAMIGRNFPIGMKRAVSIAIFGGCGPVGITLGVVFSSTFAQLVWWPWSFWALSIACAFACTLSCVVLPKDSITKCSENAEHFDFMGAITGVTGLLLINFALNQGPCVGWNRIYIVILLVLGLLIMVMFVYIELKVAATPIVPLRGLHRDAALTLACITAGWSSHGIWCYYLFLFLEGVRGQSPLRTAAEICPVALVGFCAAVAVPFILKKIRVPYLMSIAMVFFGVTTALLLTAPVGQTYWINTFLSILIAPLGMNWSFPSGTILMSNAVAKKHQGIAASLIATMVNYSIATGLGLAGTITRYTVPTHGVVGAFHDAWWLGIAFASCGFLISLYFIWESRIKNPTMAT